MPPRLVAGELVCTINSQAGGAGRRKQGTPSSCESPGILDAISTMCLPSQSQKLGSTCVAVPATATTSRLHLTSVLLAGLGPRLHPRTLPRLLLRPLHNQACPHPHLLDMGV